MFYWLKRLKNAVPGWVSFTALVVVEILSLGGFMALIWVALWMLA